MILLNSLTFFASSRTVLLTSEATSSREERIQRNYSRGTIRISHKQLFAKNFAGMESGLMESLYSRFFCPRAYVQKIVLWGGYGLTASCVIVLSKVSICIVKTVAVFT